VFVISEQDMTSRIAIFVSAAALTLAPAMLAQEGSVSPGFDFASSASQPSVASQNPKPRSIQGQRDVLELMADKLDLSGQQKGQVEALIGYEHQQLAALHQHLDLSDEQKSAQFQQIRRQTKEQFVAILTREQRREFESLMR
jgi:Spy/CpxP family protein refolding chaperone